MGAMTSIRLFLVPTFESTYVAVCDLVPQGHGIPGVSHSSDRSIACDGDRPRCAPAGIPLSRPTQHPREVKKTYGCCLSISCANRLSSRKIPFKVSGGSLKTHCGLASSRLQGASVRLGLNRSGSLFDLHRRWMDVGHEMALLIGCFAESL